MNAVDNKRIFLLAAVSISVLTGITASAQEFVPAASTTQLNFPELPDPDVPVVDPNWMPDGRSFWYVSGPADATVINKVDPRTGAVAPLFDVKRLRQMLRSVTGADLPGTGVPFHTLTVVENGKAVQFSLASVKFRLDLATYDVSKVPPEDQRYKPQIVTPRFPNPDVVERPSPDNRWFLRYKDHDAWVRSGADGHILRLTSDGAEELSWEEPVYYGDQPAEAPWSPDGHWLLITRMDYRTVQKVPLVDWVGTQQSVQYTYQLEVGMPIPRMQLSVVEMPGGQVRRIDTGIKDDAPYDDFIFPLRWRSDGSEFLYFHVVRNWKRVELRAANPLTGASRTIFVEQQPTFVEEVYPRFLKARLTLLDDNRRFIFRSERDGWNHLYLYDLNTGKMLRRLTSGAFPVQSVAGVDLEKGWVYVVARAEPRIYDDNLYRVPLERTGKIQRLTSGVGVHASVLSPSFEYFVDSYSTPLIPPVIELRRTDGTLVKELARGSLAPFQARGWAPPDEIVAKAADGVTDLYGILFKPNHFDPGRKYAVIEYIYAGPQKQLVRHTFFPEGHFLQQDGYLVFMVDGRGTPGRSKAFQDAVYRNLGINEIPDHAAALRQAAATRPYMDLDRVGMIGASYGGVYTIRAMVQAPELYKVGVASVTGGPVPRIPTMSAEPATDTPANLDAEARKSYEFGSNDTLADNLRGKLLMIVGTYDMNASFGQTMMMVDAFTRAHKYFDLIISVGSEHGRMIDGSHLTYDYVKEASRRYFLEHLPPDVREGTRRSHP